MRTLKERAAHILRKFFKATAKPYFVLARVTFVFKLENAHLDLPELRRHILNMDQAHPWVNKDPETSNDAPSIGFLGEGRVGFQNTPESSVTAQFEIAPGVRCIDKSQIQAYQNYLATLALGLAEMKLPNLIEVNLCISTEVVTTFTV
jgi:hypothetical protein